jgi:SAM-dependent methyltransferase
MNKIDSADYHDYVIKNGKLIGEFEQMYKKSETIPWHQNEQESWLDIRLTISLLKGYGPFGYICDYGCGLGYFLDILGRNLGAVNPFLVGYDISPTCCQKAKNIFPGVSFNVRDLTARGKIPKPVTMSYKKLYVIRGTLWYVFPKMENVVWNIAQDVEPGALFTVVQNFPPLEDQFVGKEAIPDPDSIINWFRPYFSPLRTLWLKNEESRGNDNWFIALFQRKTK